MESWVMQRSKVMGYVGRGGFQVRTGHLIRQGPAGQIWGHSCCLFNQEIAHRSYHWLAGWPHSQTEKYATHVVTN